MPTLVARTQGDRTEKPGRRPDSRRRSFGRDMNTHREEWYAEWFNNTYLKVYAHRNARLAESEVRFVTQVLGLRTDDSILDLCCGAGRHLFEMYRLGYSRVFGLDLSPDLLKVASQNLEKKGCLVRGDMRNLPLREKSFRAVLSLFTSFGYFREEDENLRVLKEMRRVLVPGGRVLLDLVSYGVADRLVPESERTIEGIKVTEKRRYNPDNRRIEKEITVSGPEKTEHFVESVRVYTFAEINQLFAGAEIALEAIYGDFQGTPFHPSGERMIVIGTRLSVPAYLVT